jgi:hypothetical protein
MSLLAATTLPERPRGRCRRPNGGCQALMLATASEATVSAGTVFVNGCDSDHAFTYRLTESRLFWQREKDSTAVGFAFADIVAFGSWENNGYLVLGVDVDGDVLDLVFAPRAEARDFEPRVGQHLVVRFLKDALRRAGARELDSPA